MRRRQQRRWRRNVGDDDAWAQALSYSLEDGGGSAVRATRRSEERQGKAKAKQSCNEASKYTCMYVCTYMRISVCLHVLHIQFVYA